MLFLLLPSCTCAFPSERSVQFRAALHIRDFCLMAMGAMENRKI